MAHAPNELDAIEALAAMAAGRLTAEKLTRAYIDRIGARDSAVGSYTFLDPERLPSTTTSAPRGQVDRCPRRRRRQGLICRRGGVRDAIVRAVDHVIPPKL